MYAAVRAAALVTTADRGGSQAATVAGRPIYCTQFYPELDRYSLLDRAYQYPEYVRRVAGAPREAFASRCEEAPLANELLGRFVQHAFACTPEDGRESG